MPGRANAFAESLQTVLEALSTLKASESTTEGQERLSVALSTFQAMADVKVDVWHSGGSHVDVTAYHAGQHPDDGWTGQIWRSSYGHWYSASFADPVLSAVVAGAMMTEVDRLNEASPEGMAAYLAAEDERLSLIRERLSQEERG